MYIVDPSVEEMKNPDFEFILQKWHEIMASGRFPTKADFPPQEMVSLLPKIMLFDIVHPENEPEPIFKFRLVGTAICQAIGIDPTGKFLTDIPFDPETADRMKTCIETKKPYAKYKNDREWPDLSYKDYDGLGVPLSSDGETIDHFLYIFHMERV